ncbi:MAG TPA: hypothetical protein VMM56_16465, partial [Planctomycetaceae bacterium]|nr:hypothetical protein [Planctomycetaceae bacterium]
IRAKSKTGENGVIMKQEMQTVGLGFVWAVATPSWLERLYHSALKHLFIVILLGWIPIIILGVLAGFGLKLGAGLGP